MNVTHKYGVVRAIAFVLKLLAWLALLVGLAAAVLVAISTGGQSAGTIVDAIRSLGMVIGPLVGIIWFVQLFALGSVLSLLVDIEENTRSLAEQPTVAPVDLA
jgi:hypothetical protein